MKDVEAQIQDAIVTQVGYDLGLITFVACNVTLLTREGA
jgi:hypothetical protein